ncbi:MAG: adenylate/guanylate cyclase domain-containing protein [Nevskiales bacterium]|nr:adenylate/guanylate cyclase domain-containing protein [Nevskiales bacterium]
MAVTTIRMLIRFAISGLVFLIFLIHTSGLWESRLLTTLENITYDSRVLLTLPGTVDPRVVIVDLDEKSLAAEGQWPWPRDKLARLVTQLFDTYRIRVLGFDMVFSEPDRASGVELLDKLAAGELADLPGFALRVPDLRERLDNDKTFAEALRGRRVVMGYVFAAQRAEGEAGAKGLLPPPLFDKSVASRYAVNFIHSAVAYTGNLPVLQSAAPYGGFFDLPASTLDADGIVRDVPLMQMYEGVVYPSLALEVARAALGYPEVRLEFDPPDVRAPLNLERVRVGPLFAPVDMDVSVRVPYRGRLRSFPYIPATDVLRGRADAPSLSGAIVFLGTTAAGLMDLRATPVGQGYAGVEIHANVVSGLLDGSIKQRAPYYSGMEVLLLLTLGLVLAGLFPRVSPLGAFGVAAGLIASVTGLAFLLWSSANLVMPMGVPIVYILAVFLAQLLYGYFIESRRARDISRRFGEYVPPAIVEEMAANPGMVSMEGQTRDMTVLFSDVRSFTSISEQFEAKELAELMNQFLTRLTQVIHKHRGTVDKYMGDAIMAFWGAPLPDSQHALHALQAGLELHQALHTLDEPFAKRGWPKLQIGVGFSSGPMRVGNMGSEFRRAYTVMGDPVNLASRLESLTKEYGAMTICSEYSRNAVPSEWAFRELDRVRVKGKDQPVAIYEPVGLKEALDPGLRQDLARHRGALKVYRAQQWDQAEAEFFSLSRGGHPHPVYGLFLERIAQYRKNPPGKNWDGAYTFTEK